MKMNENIKSNEKKCDQDLELVAAIIGALSVHTGKSVSQFKIKSIKRTDEFKWLDY